MVAQFFHTYRTQVILAICTASVALLFSGVLWYTDRYIADLDGDLRYSYPIEGQDAPGFVELGIGLADGDGFYAHAGYPETFRSPGYPALIAIFLTSGLGLLGLILFQILAAVVIVLVTYGIARSVIGSDGWAAAAALITALSPNLIFHTAIVLSDLVFTLCVVSAVYLLFFRGSVSYRIAFLSGLLLGLSVLFRPISILLPLVFGLGYTLLHRSFRAGALITMLLVVGALLVVTPWIARNGMLTGVYTVSTVSSYNLAHYNVPQFLESMYGTDSQELSVFNASLLSADENGYRADVSVHDGALATQVINAHLVPYTIYHVLQTSKFFLSSSVRYVVLHIQVPALQRFFGLTGQEADLLTVLKTGNMHLINETLAVQGILTLDRLLMLFATLFLAVALFAGYRRVEVLILLATIAYFAILTGPVSIPRYRLPVEPFIWILVVYALSSLRRPSTKKE